MAININKIFSPGSLIVKTADEWARQPLYFISLSGEVIPSFESRRDGKLTKEQLIIQLRLPLDKITEPAIVAGNPRYFRAKHSTVYAGLNSIFTKDLAFNNGFAVRNFRLLDNKNITDFVRMSCDLEVQNFYSIQQNRAILYRVGFKVEMLVYFERYHTPIPPPPAEIRGKWQEPVLQMMMEN